MNKLVPMLIELTLIPMLFMTACSRSAADEVKADLNKEFRLPVGQAAAITGEGLTIKFSSMYLPIRTQPTGPAQGILETAKAKEAALTARIVGSLSSTERTVTITCTA